MNGNISLYIHIFSWVKFQSLLGCACMYCLTDFVPNYIKQKNIRIEQFIVTTDVLVNLRNMSLANQICSLCGWELAHLYTESQEEMIPMEMRHHASTNDPLSGYPRKLQLAQTCITVLLQFYYDISLAAVIFLFYAKCIVSSTPAGHGAKPDCYFCCNFGFCCIIRVDNTLFLSHQLNGGVSLYSCGWWFCRPEVWSLLLPHVAE